MNNTEHEVSCFDIEVNIPLNDEELLAVKDASHIILYDDEDGMNMIWHPPPGNNVLLSFKEKVSEKIDIIKEVIHEYGYNKIIYYASKRNINGLDLLIKINFIITKLI
jgi:hypothetical protein